VLGAALLFGLTAALSEADARRGGGARMGRGHIGIHRNVGRIGGAHIYKNAGRGVARRAVVGGAVVGGAVVGRRYYGGVYYGPRRRYWRGRWWAYGVGSCWRLTPDGYYVWVCG
jgi:hypothetical protein